MEPKLRRAIGQLPHSPGVYRFRDADGRVLYIGRATDLRQRTASYWSALRGRKHLLRMVARIDRIEAVTCDSVHEAAWLERNLMERSLPRWNRTRGGQETPVHIRMDSTAGRPGLSVAHDLRPGAGVRYFGPYLGGLRTRQAVTALHRILPLAYTGSGLRGAELDLAAKRGVCELDGDALTQAIESVLEREPDAVIRARSELEQLRDRAAKAMAFELAGRVHEEIQSLDWITSVQRVTCPVDPELGEGGDDDVYGWSGGVLVGFQIRAGRLCAWSQRSCAEAGAATKLAATPSSWTAFAQQNAELAVALNAAALAEV
jgi:excinuclease ABC subunit C